MTKESIAAAYLIIVAAIAILLIVSFFFMLLWNWLMPDIFALKNIDFWQSVGLILMATLINNTRVSTKGGD